MVKLSDYRYSISFIIISLLMAVMLISCSSSTKPKEGRLVGRVVLSATGNGGKDPVDYSGVTVAVYELAPIDTTLARVNLQYPTVGVQISQKLAFDHRKQTPVASTVTDGSGSFNLQNIPEGIYNLAFIKAGYGYRYFTEVAINQGSNNLSEITDVDSLIIYQDTVLHGYYATGNFTFAKDKQVVISDETVFATDTNVTIEPGAIIRIAPDKKLFFMGNVSAQGTMSDYITFQSNYNVEQAQQTTDIQYFDTISIPEASSLTNNTMQYCNIKDMSNGLMTSGALSFKDNLVSYKTSAILASAIGNSACLVSGNIFYSNVSISDYGLSMMDYDTSTIDKNVFVCPKAVQLTSVTGTISSNYFFNFCPVINTSIGIFFDWECHPTMIHNTMYSDYIAFKTSRDCIINATYNNIWGRRRAVQLLWYNTTGTFANNNFYSTECAFESTTNNAPDVNAINNYWYTTNSEEIADLIIDKNDYSPSTYPYYSTLNYVIYSPYKTSKVTNAGI